MKLMKICPLWVVSFPSWDPGLCHSRRWAEPQHALIRSLCFLTADVWWPLASSSTNWTSLPWWTLAWNVSQNKPSYPWAASARVLYDGDRKKQTETLRHCAHTSESIASGKLLVSEDSYYFRSLFPLALLLQLPILSSPVTVIRSSNERSLALSGHGRNTFTNAAACTRETEWTQMLLFS